MKEKIKGLIAVKQRKCTDCRKLLPIKENFFPVSTKGFNGFTYRCKKCQVKLLAKKRKMGYKTNNYRAQYTVHNNIKNCKIKKEVCEVCGNQKTQAHHYLGYAKKHWLDIQWLCLTHHKQAHKEIINIPI